MGWLLKSLAGLGPELDMVLIRVVIIVFNIRQVERSELAEFPVIFVYLGHISLVALNFILYLVPSRQTWVFLDLPINLLPCLTPTA